MATWTNIGQRVTVSPEVWPGKELKYQPGDMEIFVPGGLGLGVPIMLRPWDDPLRSNPGQYYGSQLHDAHPVRNSPVNMPAGGTVYFDGHHSQEDLAVLCRMMEIHTRQKLYAVFLSTASNPPEEHYLVQMKIVSKYALAATFRALDGEEAQNWTEQPLTVGELLWAFVEDQRAIWGTGMSYELRGIMGGDGDWAKEALAFGLFVENGFFGVYRFWSRAWLVTK